jgi:hypothetical protein
VRVLCSPEIAISWSCAAVRGKVPNPEAQTPDRAAWALLGAERRAVRSRRRRHADFSPDPVPPSTNFLPATSSASVSGSSSVKASNAPNTSAPRRHGCEQGRDIVAWRQDQLWAFQCKRVQHFGPKDAEVEVDKVLFCLLLAKNSD